MCYPVCGMVLIKDPCCISRSVAREVAAVGYVYSLAIRVVLYHMSDTI